MASKLPPYVNGYGNIPKLFKEIKAASVPPKFTNDFMQTALGLKSTSYRAMIPLLKRLGFLDQANLPTQVYKEYREDSRSEIVMAKQIKEAYSDLNSSNEYAHKLTRDDLISKLRTITGAAANDKVIPNVAATFQELVKLAKFDSTHSKTKELDVEKGISKIKDEKEKPADISKLGISYTINLNLPATTEIEVFNSIFKSLKEHILGEK